MQSPAASGIERSHQGVQDSFVDEDSPLWRVNKDVLFKKSPLCLSHSICEMFGFSVRLLCVRSWLGRHRWAPS